MKYWIFNLKSNLTFDQIKTYEIKIRDLKDRIIIAPSNIYLNYFKNLNYITCAQNVSKFDMGEYTGEVNASQLKSINTDYVIVGHYERKKYFQENNDVILDKVKQAIKSNLKIILCLGSNNYRQEDLIKSINKIFNNISNKANIIIAYEPYDLIGKNTDIDFDKLENNINFIKKYIFENYHYECEIIYGGCVNNNNIKRLEKLPINGFIIGKSSLEVDDIFTFIK